MSRSNWTGPGPVGIWRLCFDFAKITSVHVLAIYVAGRDNSRFGFLVCDLANGIHPALKYRTFPVSGVPGDGT